MCPSLWYNAKYFHCPKILCVLPVYPFPQHLTASDLFTISIILPFPECCVVGILQYVAFSNWLLTFRNMYWIFFPFFVCVTWYLIIFWCWKIFHCLVYQFILSPTEEHVGYFQVLAIVNKTSLNIRVQVFVWMLSFQLFWVSVKEHNCWQIWLRICLVL